MSFMCMSEGCFFFLPVVPFPGMANKKSTSVCQLIKLRSHDDFHQLHSRFTCRNNVKKRGGASNKKQNKNWVSMSPKRVGVRLSDGQVGFWQQRGRSARVCFSPLEHRVITTEVLSRNDCVAGAPSGPLQVASGIVGHPRLASPPRCVPPRAPCTPHPATLLRSIYLLVFADTSEQQLPFTTIVIPTGRRKKKKIACPDTFKQLISG